MCVSFSEFQDNVEYDDCNTGELIVPEVSFIERETLVIEIQESCWNEK